MSALESRSRRRRRIGPSGGLMLLIVACVALLLVTYVHDKEWPWSTYPVRLHWCDRDYRPSGPKVDRAQLDPGSHRVGDVPGWFNSGEVWANTGCGADVPTGVAVRGDGDRFQRYTLEGGP